MVKWGGRFGIKVLLGISGLLLVLGIAALVMNRFPLRFVKYLPEDESRTAWLKILSLSGQCAESDDCYPPHPQPSQKELGAAGCRRIALQYVPSPLEMSQTQKCKHPFCTAERMPGSEDETIALLDALAQHTTSAQLLALSGPTGNTHPSRTFRDVLSYHNTTYTCTVEKGKELGGSVPYHFSVITYIEPLHGMMRHPSAWDCSKGKGKMRSKRLMDASYIILSAALRMPINQRKAELAQPGAPAASVDGDSTGTADASSVRSYYFDLGASAYPELSQSFLHTQYSARGIKFDRIFMWEAKKMDTLELFKEVPDQVR